LSRHCCIAQVSITQPLHWLRWLLLSIAILCGLATANADDRQVRIREAYIDTQSSVLLLNARFELTLPEGARAAVRDGSTLTFDIEFELRRSRNFWRDETIAALTQRYVINFHALSERYVLRNLNSGEQSTYGTVDAALKQLTSINALPILDHDLIEPGTAYEARMRAELDVQTLPESIRWVIFWADNWKQSGDWHLWPLKP
jgi:Domain of unknown function (DUF4390)